MRYDTAMTIMLWLLGAAAVLEVLTVTALWHIRKVIAPAYIMLAAFTSAGVVMWRPDVFSVVIGLMGLYRAGNGIRIMEGRMHEGYLRRSVRRTSLLLIALQVALGGLWYGWWRSDISSTALWLGAAGVQLCVAAVLLVTTARRLRRTTWPAAATHFTDGQLPTLTVAIPARNETDDLQLCLETIVASDYPKLEVLVLDDCSQTRRTPEIIRGFAHAGVRFIKGDAPRETWLPKNQAYQRLAAEASGDYVLFCGVDVRFEAGTLRAIVSTVLDRQNAMMSIMPERAATARGRFALAQAMRYCWELVPPRRLFNRPPVLSSCWIIKAEALRQAGGFEAVSRSIVPEAYFARRTTSGDAYSFMRAGPGLGLSSIKSATEQRATAIRTRYPQLHRRPENVLALSVAEAGLGLLPFALAISGHWLGVAWPAVGCAAAAAVLLVITFGLVAAQTHIAAAILAPLAVPAMLLYDVALLHYSMWQYEFSAVDWKGRNVCVPAMHVIPHLPPL